MLSVETRHAVHPEHAFGMGTDELRHHFLASGLFAEGEIRLIYTHYDRFVMGAAVPNGAPLTLDVVAETRTANFLDRREMGVVNVGETGTVSAAGQTYTLQRGDVLYLGKGSGAVTFEGAGRFYIVSSPAHRSCPSHLVTLADSKQIKTGSVDTSNKRTINQFIHPLVMESCQLVLGYKRHREAHGQAQALRHRLRCFTRQPIQPQQPVHLCRSASSFSRHELVREPGICSIRQGRVNRGQHAKTIQARQHACWMFLFQDKLQFMAQPVAAERHNMRTSRLNQLQRGR